MRSRQVIEFAQNLVSYFGAFIMGLLGLRIALKLFGANAENNLVSLLYDTTASLIDPFENIFPTVRIDGPFVIEFSTIFALIAYALLIGFVLHGLDIFMGKGAATTNKPKAKKSKK